MRLQHSPDLEANAQIVSLLPFQLLLYLNCVKNTAVNVTSYFLLFALQGNKTTNGGADNSLCANNIQIPQGDSKTYFCRSKAYGRYLYIRLLRKIALTLCEVEVHSYLKSESKSAFLSSCLYYRYAWCLSVYLVSFFLPFAKKVICFKNCFV